jgi:hypothetical protein
MIRRVVFAFFVGGVLAQSASAQAPSRPVYPTPQAPPIPAAADVPPPPPRPVETTQVKGPAKTAEARQVVAQAKPLPRRTSVGGADLIARRDSSASQGRYANPGGVGLYSEYYTANTPTSQFEMHPRPRTGFDQGGGPNRAEQIAAFRAGQQRTANIQNNINAYGRPYGAYGAGIGFGLGLYGGLYGGGYR